MKKVTVTANTGVFNAQVGPTTNEKSYGIGGTTKRKGNNMKFDAGRG